MRHLRIVSRRPAPAQFEPVLQFIGVLQSALGFINSLINTLGQFGIEPPQKGGEQG